MTDAITRGLLGDFGSRILDFYIENALWINAIILLYAVSLILAKQGYAKITQIIKMELVAVYGEEVQNKNVRWFNKTLERSPLDWREISKKTWIPIVSNKKSSGWFIKTPNALKKSFPPEKVHDLFHGESK